MPLDQGPPTFLAYLRQKWIDVFVKKQEEKGTLLAHALQHAEQSLDELPVDSFIGWCDDFLAEVRPAQTFAINNNLGVRFTNNESVSICPDTPVEEFQMGQNSVRIT